MQPIPNISVAALARAKSLDAGWLRAFGLTDTRYEGEPAVRIPYNDATGRELHAKVRLSDGSMRYVPTGSTPALYLTREPLAHAGADATALIHEGESDGWAAARHSVSSAGVPGVSTWRPEFADTFQPFRTVVLWQEPGAAAEKLVRAIARDLPRAMVITGDSRTKDLCELHEQTGDGFRAALEDRIAHAVPITTRAAELIAVSPAPTPRRVTPRSAAHPQAVHTEFDVALDRARSRSVVDVLDEYGIVWAPRAEGRRARCPFHDDSTPSFSVSRAKGTWYCHGCGFGGDAIAFVERFRGIDFPAAVRELAGVDTVVIAHDATGSVRMRLSPGTVLHAAQERVS